MSEGRTAFVSWVDGVDWKEATVDGRVAKVVPEPPFVRPPRWLSGAIKRGLGVLLKWTGRGLLLGSPLALVTHLIVQQSNPRASDYVTVGYVLAVVLFFAILNCFVVASAFAWHFRRKAGRHADVRLPFSSSGDDALGVLSDRAPAASRAGGSPPKAGARVRVTGTVVELSPAVAKGGPVVRDAWVMDRRTPGRWTETVPFAVCADGQFPVVLHCATAPLLLARPSTSSARDALAHLADAGARQLVEGTNVDLDGEAFEVCLAAGDEVEVLGTVAESVNLASFELGGRSVALPELRTPGSPYRGSAGRRGVVIEASWDCPVVLRRC